MKKRIGLALGGGGARGLCHIEFCRAMDEMGVKPSIISGTSMGAIVGAFYAGGMSGAEMEKMARSIDILDFTKMIDVPFFGRSGLVKGRHVMDFLRKHLPTCRFEELAIPLKIVATDFWNRKEVVFSEGDLIQAIRASISVPGVFEPVKINGLVMIDGEPVNPVPMSVIRDACDILIAVDASGSSEEPNRNPIPHIFDNIMMTFQIMESTFVQNQIRIYEPEIYIKPALVNVQILDFHKTEDILNSLQEDVERFKKELKRKMVEEDRDKKKKRRFLFFQ